MYTTKTFNLIAGLLVCTGLCFLTSCRKDDHNPESLMDQFLESESENEEITHFEDQSAESCMSHSDATPVELSDALSSSRCVTVTRDTVSVPRRITLDYGTVNCLCRDGKYRRGIVYIDYTGQRGTPGSTAQMTFSGYYVNNRGISGTRNLAFALNAAGNPERVAQFNLTITRPNGGGSMTRQGQRVREMIAGDSTLTLLDDVYLISGYGSGTGSNGSSYNHTVVTPLRREGSCRWLVSGSIEFRRNNLATRTLDYGNGTCDNQATLSQGSRTRTITLP